MKTILLLLLLFCHFISFIDCRGFDNTINKKNKYCEFYYQNTISISFLIIFESILFALNKYFGLFGSDMFVFICFFSSFFTSIKEFEFPYYADFFWITIFIITLNETENYFSEEKLSQKSIISRSRSKTRSRSRARARSRSGSRTILSANN